MAGVHHLSLVCIVVALATANRPAFAARGAACTIYLTEGGSCLHATLNPTVPIGNVLTHVANKQACKRNVNYTFPGSAFESFDGGNTTAWPRGCSYAHNNKTIWWNEGGLESKTANSVCCIAKAKSGDYEVAPDRWKVQFDYNLTSAVYSNLTNYIKDIKSRGKPLRIKVNSHPCAGKSYFIQRNKATKKYHSNDIVFVHGGEAT